MSRPTPRPPRLFVFVWFIAAAGVLAGGVVLRSMGFTGAWETTLPWVLAAFFAGQGVGEWRGLLYARSLQRG